MPWGRIGRAGGIAMAKCEVISTTNQTTLKSQTVEFRHQRNGQKHEPIMVDASATIELSKSDRRRIARAAKKQKLAAAGKAMNPASAKKKKLKAKMNPGGAAKAPKPKLTHEERKEKYTKKAHDRSRAKAEKKKHSSTVCFVCRVKGHAAADCPQNTDEKICFRCGSSDHRLDDCPKGASRSGDLPFATCYICKGKGHLSGRCPENDKGVYVNGGCCKLCGGVDHLESLCPVAPAERKRARDEARAVSLMGPADVCYDVGQGGDEQPSLEVDDSPPAAKKKAKVVKF